MEREIRIAVLMTCHNRREFTLRCLQSLVQATEGIGISAEVDVFLNDDGSTDGTGEEVRAFELGIRKDGFAIHVVKGSGGDFWARGMARAWHAALDYEEGCRHSSPSSFPFISFLWLNDDTVLHPHSLSALLALSSAHPSAVVVGECCDPDDVTKKTYGLQDRWFNGNVVLVPRCVYEKVGMIDGTYAHSKADYDYAERVRRAGFEVVVTHGFVATCRADWMDRFRGKSLAVRMGMLFRPGYWNLRDLWLFRCRYYGVGRAVLSCLHLIWMVLKGVG